MGCCRRLADVIRRVRSLWSAQG